MRKIIIFSAALLFSLVSTHASEAGVYIGKTRPELIDLYAPIRGVEKNDTLVFNADVGGVPCVIAYSFSRGIAKLVHCNVNNADLTNQSDALIRWSKLIKEVVASRQVSDVQLKLDGIPIVGKLLATEDAPTVIEISGSWDEKYGFSAVFGGPFPKTAARNQMFEMSLHIYPKLSLESTR